VTGDAQRLVQMRFGPRVRENRRVRYRLDEPGTKDRSRDAKDDVRISTFAGQRVSGGPEAGLGDVATRGVLATGDDEQVVHAAVVGPVRIALEACLADGTVLRDKPWHHVSCPVER